MTKKLPLQKHLFDIPDEVTFLNHAFFAPQLRAMTEAGLQSVRAKSSPWNYTPQHWFEDGETLRGLIAQIIGVASDDMAIIPSVSYGMAIVAKNITVRSDQNIVVLHEEFPS
ncbi:MAG TPA: aminotransferase, partial [bacterium]|nr:aminotransferase [bacterium]